MELKDYIKNLTWDDIKDLDSEFNFASIVDLPTQYDAILYIVIINKTGQNKYVGFDTKGFDGTYIGSPVKNKKQYFKDIADYDWKCICIAYGDKGTMASSEKEILTYVDAKNNTTYYNASNGGSEFMKGLKSSEICEKIKSKLKNNEYEKVLEPKEKVHSISAFQVREEANGSTKSKKKVKDIWYKLQDTKGKWLKENGPGILVLEDYFGKGSHLRIGTWHGLEAAMKCDFVFDVTTIYIPKKDWNGIDENEVEDLGLWDNRKGDNLQDYLSISEAVSNCVKYVLENGCQHTDPPIHNKLNSWGFGSEEKKKIISDMRKEIVKNRIIPIGHTRINRNADDLRELEINNSDKNTHCFVLASTCFSNKWNDWETFIKQTQIKEALKKPNWHILWHHLTDAAYDDWAKVKYKKNENGIKEPLPTRKTKTESFILQLASVLKFEPTITFKDLEFTQLKKIKKSDDKKVS